jgi:hypothetical protein
MVRKNKPAEVEPMYTTGDFLAIHEESQENNFTVVYVTTNLRRFHKTPLRKILILTVSSSTGPRPTFSHEERRDRYRPHMSSVRYPPPKSPEPKRPNHPL